MMSSKDAKRPVYHSAAVTTKPIYVPEDLSEDKFQGYYQMPKLTKPLSKDSTVSLLPPGSLAAKTANVK